MFLVLVGFVRYAGLGLEWGMGKRGGLRVIYVVRYRPNEFCMLTLHAKATRENVPAHILKQPVEVFRNG